MRCENQTEWQGHSNLSPKDCGIDKYLGEEVYCEIKDKKVRISKAHQPHVRVETPVEVDEEGEE